VKFVGVDLAWSNKNDSGFAVIEAQQRGNTGRLDEWHVGLKSDKAIVERIMDSVDGRPCLVAIDAPLRVSNKTGMRVCDKHIKQAFQKYDAGPYPANRTVLKKYGGLRGEKIVKLLEKKGIEFTPYLKRKAETRQVLEVYPHPAMVSLFRLPKVLKYKARKDRSYEVRWHAMDRLQQLLLGLEREVPRLFIPIGIFEKSRGLKGYAFKRREDLMDAIVCAYVGFYYWYWGEKKCRVFGSLEGGHIVTPVLNRKLRH